MTRVRLLVIALVSAFTVVVTVQAWTEAKSADQVAYAAADCSSPSVSLRSLSGSSTKVGDTAEFEATVTCADGPPRSVPDVLFSVTSQDGNNPDLAPAPGTPAGDGSVRFGYTRANAGRDSITASVAGSDSTTTPAASSTDAGTSPAVTSATTSATAPTTTPDAPRATATVTATETVRETATATATATTTATVTATATVTETATVTATATVTETATITVIPPPVTVTVTETPAPVIIFCPGDPACPPPPPIGRAQALYVEGMATSAPPARTAAITHDWTSGADQVSCRLDGGLSPGSADDVTFLCGGCPPESPVTIGVDGEPVSAQIAPAVDEVGIQTTLPDLPPGTHTATVRCGQSDTDVEFGVVGTTLSSGGAGGSAGAASAVMLFFVLVGWMLLPRIRGNRQG